jgi:hypothetical protein
MQRMYRVSSTGGTTGKLEKGLEMEAGWFLGWEVSLSTPFCVVSVG